MNGRTNMSFNKYDRGLLNHDIIFKNYKTKLIYNPWIHGLANTFVNSVNYLENSDRKLFRLFQNPRVIADFESKIVETRCNVFPRTPLDCGWIDYPNLKYPKKTTGVGLRRIQLSKSKCFGMKKPFRLESLRESKSITHLNIPNSCLPTTSIYREYKPELPRYFGRRPDMMPNVKDNEMQTKIRPIPQKLDCWIKVPYTTTFFNNVKEFEINNYLIHELMKFDKTYLSEGDYANSRYALLHTFRMEKKHCVCQACQKATKARTIIEATTNWLGFTNKEVGAEKLSEIISVFTGNNQFMEYHLIEEPSKAIIIKQMPLSTHSNIGINGEPVSHSREDFTIISEITLAQPFQKKPEYNKDGRQVVEIYPKCGEYKPLSWEEQLVIPGVKILYGEGRNIQRPNEINKPTAVANKEEAFNSKKFLPRNPDVSDRSILEIKDWFSFCKLTRSLIRSTPHFTQLVDPSPAINRSLSEPIAIYDGVVRDCLDKIDKKEQYVLGV